MSLSERLPGLKPGHTKRNVAVGFVYVFAFLMVLGAAAPAEDTESASDEPTDTPEMTETPAPEDTEAGDTTEEPAPETEAPETEAPDSGDSGGEGYQVRISYDGEWQGALGKEGETRSVDGSGTETFDIEGDAFVVSANAQKQDSGSGELTVEILKDGEVVAEQSTTAEYGVASTSTTE